MEKRTEERGRLLGISSRLSLRFHKKERPSLQQQKPRKVHEEERKNSQGILSEQAVTVVPWKLLWSLRLHQKVHVLQVFRGLEEKKEK